MKTFLGSLTPLKIGALVVGALLMLFMLVFWVPKMVAAYRFEKTRQMVEGQRTHTKIVVVTATPTMPVVSLTPVASASPALKVTPLKAVSPSIPVKTPTP